MKPVHQDIYTLENFEGPLDLLWHLISKQEIDIYQIPIKEITDQFLEKENRDSIDEGAEFVALAATLVWYKSKTLLPRHEQIQDDTLEEGDDPRFEIIHHLVDYCRFKDAAKQLTEREQQQNAYYFRGVDNDLEVKKKLGIDHLSIEDLADLFQQILDKSIAHKGVIHEEEWRVADKIVSLRELLESNQKVNFHSIFYPERPRAELIVFFLALLELMKLGEAKVGIESINKSVCIFSTKGN